jgi:hypothetical protein
MFILEGFSEYDLQLLQQRFQHLKEYVSLSWHHAHTKQQQYFRSHSHSYILWWYMVYNNPF